MRSKAAPWLRSLDLGKAHAAPSAAARSWMRTAAGSSAPVRRCWGCSTRQSERARTWWFERLLSILGFVEFAAGDHEAADRALDADAERYDSMGVTEPLLDWSEPFQVESLLALGELERAKETLSGSRSGVGGSPASGST